MELSLPHTLHLFNIFRENDGKENCAQVLEEECIKMFGTKYLNDEHDCNVVSMNSLNIHSTNDDCTSHDENVSYKHVDFCGVHCNIPNFQFGMLYIRSSCISYFSRIFRS